MNWLIQACNTKVFHCIPSFKSDDLCNLSSLQDCLSAIKDWMSNFLQLNPHNTEATFMSPGSISESTAIYWFFCSKYQAHPQPKKNKQKQKFFEWHIKEVEFVSFNSIKKNLKFKPFFPFKIWKKKVFVSTQLLWFIVHHLSHSSVSPLPLVHWTFDITWLPMQGRVDFKSLFITYKAPYFSITLSLDLLRSSNQALLATTKSRTKCDQASAVWLLHSGSVFC